MKKTPIEKYQYLSVLRNTNVHLFYRLLSNNIKVCESQKPDCQEVRSDNYHRSLLPSPPLNFSFPA
jgi:hypothetical protein